MIALLGELVRAWEIGVHACSLVSDDSPQCIRLQSILVSQQVWHTISNQARSYPVLDFHSASHPSHFGSSIKIDLRRA